MEHQNRAWSVDFSQLDPMKFASGSDDCSIRLWNLNEVQSLIPFVYSLMKFIHDYLIEVRESVTWLERNLYFHSLSRAVNIELVNKFQASRKRGYILTVLHQEPCRKGSNREENKTKN